MRTVPPPVSVPSETAPPLDWLRPGPWTPEPAAFERLVEDEDEAAGPSTTAGAVEVAAMSITFDASATASSDDGAEAAAVAPPPAIEADEPKPERLGDGADAAASRPPGDAGPGDAGAPSTPVVERAALGDRWTRDVPAVDPAAFDGDGTAVIVIDDGWSPYYDQSNVVFDHDFAGIGDSSAGRWTLHSHGSWVADVATDVAPAVDVVHLKVFGDDGGASFADVEEALQWSVRYGERFGAVAVNMSLGVGNATGEVRTMLSDELAALAAQDVVTTVAAGNHGDVYDDGVNILAADPNAVAVSAVDRDDRFTSWSQKSEALTDVAALGEDVLVDTAFGWGVEVSGTSFAAPYLAGTAARLQDAAAELIGERLSPEEIVRIATESGRDVRGAPDDVDGYTVADADAAVDWFVEHHATFADDALIA